jgi:hypothetical protein
MEVRKISECEVGDMVLVFWCREFATLCAANLLMLIHHFWALKKLGWFGMVENFERQKISISTAL